MKDIKEMLKNGDKTPDELRAILEKEIAAAQEEMKKQESESIETRRNDLALSLIRYGEALGLDFDIEVEDAAAMLKEIEPELRKYAKILKILLEDIEVDEDEDEIKRIGGFESDGEAIEYLKSKNIKNIIIGD